MVHPETLESKYLSSLRFFLNFKIECRCPFQTSAHFRSRFSKFLEHKEPWYITQYVGFQLQLLWNIKIWKQFWDGQYFSQRCDLTGYIFADTHVTSAFLASWVLKKGIKWFRKKFIRYVKWAADIELTGVLIITGYEISMVLCGHSLSRYASGREGVIQNAYSCVQREEGGP